VDQESRKDHDLDKYTRGLTSKVCYSIIIRPGHDMVGNGSAETCNRDINLE